MIRLLCDIFLYIRNLYAFFLNIRFFLPPFKPKGGNAVRTTFWENPIVECMTEEDS